MHFKVIDIIMHFKIIGIIILVQILVNNYLREIKYLKRRFSILIAWFLIFKLIS